jgi:hypothetical protein
MRSEKAEFIHIDNAYINVDAVAWVRTADGGLAIILNDKTSFVVPEAHAAKVEEFFAKHTVLDIHKPPPTGGFQRGTIL